MKKPKWYQKLTLSLITIAVITAYCICNSFRVLLKHAVNGLDKAAIKLCKIAKTLATRRWEYKMYKQNVIPITVKMYKTTPKITTTTKRVKAV